MKTTTLFVMVLFFVLITSVSATWCDTDFAKRINVSVNNTGGGALTDYQIFINLTSNPINETSLRVYNSTSCTLRPHWTENETGGNSYGVWINYSSIAASAWTNNTAIYYDNAAVSSVSNGTNTFEFFDDFESWSSDGQNYFVSDIAYYGASTDVFGPQATYHNNKTYVSLHGNNEDAYIIEYNHATGEWSDPVYVGDNPLSVGDAHGSPAILRDSSGYLHIFYGSHGTAQKHAKSTNPDNISLWTAKNDIGTTHTYPSPLLANNGDMYLLLRHKATSQRFKWGYYKSTDNGENWGSVNDIIDFGTGYATYAGRPDHQSSPERIHIAWVQYKYSAAKYQNAYYAYYNISDGHMYAADGTDLGTTIDLTEATNNCLIASGDNIGRAYVRVYDGVPYVIINDNSTFKFTKWNGSAWAALQTITTTTAFQKSYDFIVHSSTNIEAYFDTGNVIEKWNYSGLTWSQDSVIANGSDYHNSLACPAIVHNYTNNLKMTFSQELLGNNNKAFAHGDSGFVKTTPGVVGDRSAWTDGAGTGTNGLVTSPVYNGKHAFNIDGKDAHHNHSFSGNTTIETAGRFSEVGDRMNFYIIEGIAANYAVGLNSGCPTSGYWGYLTGGAWVDSGVANNINTWYEIKIILFPGTEKYSIYIDGTTICENVDYFTAGTNADQILLAGYVSYYDLFRVRKYASPEPSTSLGSEEQQGANPTLHIGNTINIKEDWGRDFNSNFSANVTTANASEVWMNFTNAEFTNTSLGNVNLTLDEWVNESHNVNAPVTNVSVDVCLNSTTSGATNDTDSFWYEITKRTNTATMGSAATQFADISETFYVNATCNEEYGDTFLGAANLLEDGAIIDTNSSVTNYVNFSHSEAVAGVYNYTVRFYNLTHYYNATTPTYSNVTVTAPTYTPPDPVNLQNTSGDYWVNYTWDAGSGNITNLYNVSWNLTWYNDTSVTYMNDSVGAGNWANITVYAFNSSSGGTLSSGSVSDEVKVSDAPLGDYIPPDPTNLQNTTGNYWVNYTWNIGGGNVTDSYNVSWNLTWYNTTTDTFMKKEVGASNWANITVYAYNTSGNGSLSAGYVSDNVQSTTIFIGGVPKIGIYNPSIVGFIRSSDGDYYAEISKFFQTEFFGDDVATNITELKQMYDVIAVIGSETRISVEVENNFTQFVNDGGGLFVAGPLVGWKYSNGTTRPGKAFCKDVFGLTSVGETCAQRNITFNSNMTNEKHIHTGCETLCYSYFSIDTGTAFAWREGAATIHGVKNEYGLGRSVYFGSCFIGEGGIGALDVNFTGRDEFIHKIFNWLNGGNLTEPDVSIYPLQNAHNAVIVWTIDDGIYASTRYKNFSREEIFEWFSHKSGLQSHGEDVKEVIDNHNTVMVGLHPSDEPLVTRNTSKTPEEVQSDVEQYITDCKNVWENLGYTSSYITGWRSSGLGMVYDPDNSYYDTGTLSGDEKVPVYPAFTNQNFTYTSEFYNSEVGNVKAQFPFNIVANPGYGSYNNSTTYSFLADSFPQDDLTYINSQGSIVGWNNAKLIPWLDESLERHSRVMILSHAGGVWNYDEGPLEVRAFLDYTEGKNVLFSDHDTFTNFWNAKNNVNLSYDGSNITVQAQDAIQGLTLQNKENILSAKVGNDYLIFVKDDRVVLPEIKASETLNVTIQNGSYNTSIPRISSITTTHPIYVLNAIYNPSDKRVSLTLDLPYLYKSIYGSKSASVNIENHNSPFLSATITTIYPNDTLCIYANVSGETNITSANIYVSLNNSVNFSINNFNTSYKKWTESSSFPSTVVNHTIGDFPINRGIDIYTNQSYFNTYQSNSSGYINFTYDQGFSTIEFVAQNGSGHFNTSMTTTVYNLITYYGESNSTAEQFGLDIGNVEYIARYNNVTVPFTTHTMGHMDNNFTTIHGMSYFVFVNASGSSTYQRNNISDSPYNTNLLQRWNTIGWTNSTDTNAEGLMSSIGSACKYTSMLNADGWSYTTHTLGFASNNYAVDKGKGYWVWVNAGVNWGRNS